MMFDVAMRIWIAIADVVCDVCDAVETHRMTQSMLADKLMYGHTCQLCVDQLVASH